MQPPLRNAIGPILLLIIVLLGSFLFYFQQTGDAFFFHTVPEGHVGVYRRFGAILSTVSDPGLHFMNPLTTDVNFIQITLQTDTVTNIPCGTSGGVTIYFDKIEVVNRLDKNHVHQTVKQYGVNYDKIWIFDKIHHEINQFCSSHTLHQVYIDMFDKLDESLASAIQNSCDKYDTGIEIIAIRVTKPKIPSNILSEFEAVEGKKAQLLVLEQEQAASRKSYETKAIGAQMIAEQEANVARIGAEKESMLSKIKQQQQTAEVQAEAERKALVSKIHQDQLTAEKQAAAERERIDNKLFAEKEKLLMEIWYERQSKEVDLQQKRLTPQYLQLKQYEELSKALGQNTKIYFGDSIPKMLISLLPTQSDELKDLLIEKEK